MKKRAVRGTFWIFLGYGGSQFLRLLSNLVLTRLLAPELFGLMGLVNTFINGLARFSDIGIRPSIMRSQRWNDPIFINTAWTLQALRGIGLWIICCIIAWPVSKIYGEVSLLWLLPIVGLSTVMNGFASTSLITLDRKLEIRKVTQFNVVIQFLSISIMIVWSYFQQTIWALVGGSFISNFIKMIGSHRLTKQIPHRFAWEKESLNELISFGRWIMLATLMGFLASQADRLILAQIFSFKTLGVYTVAITLAQIPRALSSTINQRILLPIFSNYNDLERGVFRKKLLRKRWWILLAMIGMITIITCFGDFFVLQFYDSRYQDAAWMLPILSLGFWPMILNASINSVLLVVGKPVYATIGSFLMFIYMLVCIPLGYTLIGPLGAIIAVAFNDIPNYIVIKYGLLRERLSVTSQDILSTVLLGFMIIIVAVLRNSLGYGYPIIQPLHEILYSTN